MMSCLKHECLRTRSEIERALSVSTPLSCHTPRSYRMVSQTIPQQSFALWRKRVILCTMFNDAQPFIRCWTVALLEHEEEGEEEA